MIISDSNLPLHMFALFLNVIGFVIYDLLITNVIHCQIILVFLLTSSIILSTLIAADLIKSRRVPAVLLFDIMGFCICIYTAGYYLIHKNIASRTKVSPYLVGLCSLGCAICLAVDGFLKVTTPNENEVRMQITPSPIYY